MVRIPTKKTVFALIISTILSSSFVYANTPLEEYVDMTILEESKTDHTSVQDTVAAQTQIPSIESLLDMDHYTRHSELIKVLDKLQKGADNNNRNDLLLLGYYYYSEAEDNAKDEDFAKAKDYFTQAENMGSQDASYLLGDLYYYGEGVTQDYTKAAEYYEKAGQHPHALFSLGSLYMHGDGVAIDTDKGVALYTQSADLHNATAQHTLGYLYESGDFTALTPDLELASAWYKTACENHETRSCDALKRISIHSKSFEEIFEEIKQDYAAMSDSEPVDLIKIDQLQNLDDYEQFNLLSENIAAIIPATEAGNPDATYLLGLLYQLKGDDYFDEYAYGQAKSIYEKAQTLGSSEAIFSLGELYYYGNGIAQDYQKSLELYTSPLLKDHPEALFSIGVQYDLGEGVEQSYEKSFEYFLKASALNHNPSTFNVGYMYENGEFVDKDLTEARKWYQQSCDNNYEEGCIAVNTLDDNSTMEAAAEAVPNYQLQNIFHEIMGETEGITLLELTPASILAANNQEARHFLNQSSDKLLENIKTNNDTDSLFLMAYLFFLEGNENADETLYRQSYALLEKAAEEGSSDAVFYLGILSYEGLGTPQDYIKSKEYFESLVDSNNAEALFYLASIYDDGLETEKDQEKSFNLYLKAANLDHADSAYNVAFMYQYGEFVEQNLLEAQSWYGKACLLGDDDACNQAAMLDTQIEEQATIPEKNLNQIEGQLSNFFDEILDIFAP